MTEAHYSSDMLTKVIAPISKRYGASNIQFEFCIYWPHKRYEMPKQTLHRVSPENIETWLSDNITHLRKGFEIGLSSRVFLEKSHDNVLHIPMIDLKGVHTSGLDDLSQFLKVTLPQTGVLTCFASGRSYHMYGNQLLDELHWSKFFGALLLFSESSHSMPVDIRWIGHRLIDGFACLRWTNNSKKYKQIPTLLIKPSLRHTSTRTSSSIH